MTIQVTPFQLLAFGFLVGGVCGAFITAYVFYSKIQRVLGMFQSNLQRAATSLTERIPRLTHTVGQLGLSAALVELTTGVINDVTRGVSQKIKARTARKPIGFMPETDKENTNGH